MHDLGPTYGIPARSRAPPAIDPALPPIDAVLKYNRLTGQWDDVAQSITLDGTKTKIVFSVQNGGPYDADGNANDSTIEDPLVPAILPKAIPTLNERVLMMLSCLLALASLVVLRRRYG